MSIYVIFLVRQEKMLENLTIETLGDFIEGSHILHEENVDQLLANEHSVYLFMGAGDVQKYQQAFEEKLNK